MCIELSLEITTLILAIATFIMALFTGLYVRETRRLVEETAKDRRMRRAQIRLDKLYHPLYHATRLPLLKDPWNDPVRRNEILKPVERYLYLASPQLRDLLIPYFTHYCYKQRESQVDEDKDAHKVKISLNKIISLIKEEYKEQQSEFKV